MYPLFTTFVYRDGEEGAGLARAGALIRVQCYHMGRNSVGGSRTAWNEPRIRMRGAPGSTESGEQPPLGNRAPRTGAAQYRIVLIQKVPATSVGDDESITTSPVSAT